MSEKAKNCLIGGFISLAIAIAIGIILFIDPKIGDGKKIIKVCFSNVNGLNIGTRVTLAGKPVGEVFSIKELSNARKENRVDQLGRVYFYELILKVDSKVKVYSTDLITLQTSGLMGEKAIAIIPKAPDDKTPSYLINDEVMYANAMDPLQNAINQLSEAAGSIKTAVDGFHFWFTTNQSTLGQSVTSFNEAATEIRNAAHTLNQEKLIDSLKLASESFSGNMKSLQKALDEIAKDEMISKVNNILSDFSVLSASLKNEGVKLVSNAKAISDALCSNEGSIGKLINDSEIYLRFTGLMNKAETMLNDINHYGLLFQYNKRWQTGRIKRANLLATLSSPKEFKEYFEKEMSDINCSLGRISVLVDKVDTSQVQKDNFQKGFLELLKRVESLRESLRLYSEKLPKDN